MKLFAFFIFSPIFLFSQKVDEIQIADTNKLGKVHALIGTLKTIELYRKFLEEPRKITIYEPPYYSRDSSYGVVFLIDNFAINIANYVEYLISNNKIKPIILVGIHNREPQPIDENIKGYHYDFRMAELLKNTVRFTDNQSINPYSDSIYNHLVENRYSNFCNYLKFEVIPYIKQNYQIYTKKKEWTIGGFSNGGAFVYGLTTDYPGLFGNSIVMSPAGFNGYNIKNAKGNYYLCAGTLEHESFMQNSLEYLKRIT